VAFLYGVTSVSITFFNKAVLSVYGFPYSNTLTLGQMVSALVFLVVMKRYGIISYPDYSIQMAKKLIPLSVSFLAMVVTGLAALALVNVPMYSVLRRGSTVIVMAMEYVALGKVYSFDETQSVVMMVGGAVVAGWGDLEFDVVGYILTALNCLVTALYLIYIAKKSQETRLNTFGLMFYNNLLSIPMVTLIVLFTEMEGLKTYEHYWDFGFLFCFMMSSVQAFLLNYFIFLCSTVNSPLTTSITGQIKAILSTVLGLIAFGDVVLTTLLAIGLTISSVGSVSYTYIKYEQKND